MSRSIKELLEIALENEECFNNEGGLCGWFSMLCRFQLIDYKEMIILINYAKANKPSIFTSIYRFIHRNNGFWWKKGDITPRIKWIKKHIKKNS